MERKEESKEESKKESTNLVAQCTDCKFRREMAIDGMEVNFEQVEETLRIFAEAHEEAKDHWVNIFTQKVRV